MSPADPRAPDAAPLIIDASRAPWLDVRELWAYRDLLYLLTRREVSLRYKQTLLGGLWAILQPLLSMVVFTVFLGRLAKVPSDDLPYPVFAYLGLLPWTFFSGAVGRCGGSLVGNANLLRKVYFPRLLIPLSAALAALVDFALAFVVLIGLLAYYGLRPTETILWALPLTLAIAAISTAVGLWLAALNVQFRDVQYATPFLLQLWMFMTPVVYPASLVPERWRTVYALNPLTGLIEGFRSAVVGRPLDWTSIGVSLLGGLALMVVALAVFRRLEDRFADVI